MFDDQLSEEEPLKNTSVLLPIETNGDADTSGAKRTDEETRRL